VASNAERWNALFALARIENCWSLYIVGSFFVLKKM